MLEAIVLLTTARRVDRRALVEKEIASFRQEHEDGIVFHAIEGDPTGLLGCARGHATIAAWVVANHVRHALVLEDDFVWTSPPAEAHALIGRFLRVFGDTYGICQISHHRQALAATRPTAEDSVVQVEASQDASGYLLSHAGAAALGPIYDAAFGPVLQYGIEHDRHRWVSPDVLQNKLRLPRYAIVPRLGRQRPGFSDLRGGHADDG